MAAIAGALASAPVAAGSTQGTIAVTLNVPESCAVDTAPLTFGNTAQAQAPLRMRCTPGTPYSIAIDEGRSGARRMTDGSGAHFVSYEIYQDALGQQRWGSGAGATVDGSAPADGQVVFAAYGRAERSGAEPGSYSDVVTVTVAF